MSQHPPENYRCFHQTASAIAPGNGHRARGIPSQDAVSVETMSDGIVTIAVMADGAGSQPYAHAGAWYATKGMMEAIKTSFFPSLRPRITRNIGYGRVVDDRPWSPVDAMLRREFTDLRSALKQHAACQGHISHDYGCTLQVAFSFANGDTWLLQIGDGLIVTGPPWRLVFAPQQGQSRGYTRFLTDDDALDAVQIAKLPAYAETIVMCSDGLLDLVIEPGTLAIHAPFFDWVRATFRDPDAMPLDRDVSKLLASVLDGPEVRELTSDDTSIAVITNLPNPRYKPRS